MGNHAAPAAADIVIPVRNGYPRTRALLESIYRYTLHPFHLYVIDNNSSDETRDLGRIYSRNITVVSTREHRGWAAVLNQGIGLGSNPHVALLNPLVEVSTRWLERLTAFLESHPRIGAVVPLSSNRNDRQFVDRVRQGSAPEIPRFFSEDLHERNAILEYHFSSVGILVDGHLDLSCAVLRRRAFDQTGPFGDLRGISRIYSEYCTRLRKAGYVLGVALDTYIHRHEADGIAETMETLDKAGEPAVRRGVPKSAQGTYI